MTDRTVLLREGKTKRIWESVNNTVLVESKDDITAGDGARRDVIEGKAAIATTTTANCLRLLERCGIPTSFIRLIDDRTFRAHEVDMIPLELVARRIATGSYLKRRPDVTEGTIFENLVVEFFEKDDANHDPLVIIDLASRRLLRYVASQPLADGFIGEAAIEGSAISDLDGEMVIQLIDITRWVFEALEDAWAKQDVALVDLKIECGMMVENGEIIVADVIDNDSWRIWPAGDKTQMMDKQVYRDLADTDDPAAKAKELGKIKGNYAWVAEATGKFLE